MKIIANWIFNFGLAWAVPPGLATIAWKTYFIFGTFNFAAFIHIFFCFPETAQSTLEEVEEIFAQGHEFSAWKIGKQGVGKKTLQDVIQNGSEVSQLWAQLVHCSSLTDPHLQHVDKNGSDAKVSV
jgi:hypothetical protein